MTSIYIHWPFCLSLCPYCDFNSHLAGNIDHDLWLKSYEKEIDYFKDQISGRDIKSIFFGGGTPSLMHPKTVEGIIDKISSIGTISNKTEITLEANPTSFEINKFKDFKKSGINRVSIGVQSLQTDFLKILGRKHTNSEAVNAIKSASKIFDRYSFDLIYAITGQTLKNWQDELREALKLANGHISLYQLTIEKGTPFYKLFHTGKMVLPSNDIAASMYEWTNDFLSKTGYNNYEISNYAKAGNECKHNLTYWNYNEYIGIGPGAHSRIHQKDSTTLALMMIHKPEKWLSSVSLKGHGLQIKSKLSKQELVEEIVMMGTRLKIGMSISNFNKLTNLDFNDIINHKTFDHYYKSGLVFKNTTHFGLTSKGIILHNYLIPRLI